MATATVPPEEVRAPPGKAEAYIAWRATTDLRAPFRVAPEVLMGTRPDAEFDVSETPLIVFINARSGGRVGPELAGVLARALGRSQVFDLSEHRPDKVLAQVWANLEALAAAGSCQAALTRERLRILVCGGDGTVAWCLKVIQELQLQPPPPVAIMPLGTGNDLSRSFRWGAEFVKRWIKGQASVYATLKQIADAPVANLDFWRLRLRLPNASYLPARTYALTEVEQQQQQQHSALGQAPLSSSGGGGATGSNGGCAGEDRAVVMEGLFWNYFSVGADAQAAYRFHHLRDVHPRLAGSRLANQFWYSTFSCTSGWFCGTLPSVSGFSRVEVLLPGQQQQQPQDGAGKAAAAAAGSGADGSGDAWRVLAIPPSIKALVLVNLQSYGGGRNIWGDAPPKRPGKWAEPDVADGLLEVVGFHSGYHAMAVMASGAKLANGKRLAQVRGIRLALAARPRSHGADADAGGGGGADAAADAAGASSHDSGSSASAGASHNPDGCPAGEVYMQLDGEPWVQHVPLQGQQRQRGSSGGSGGGGGRDCIVLEVLHGGVSRVLANRSTPDKHPESHITKLLSDEENAAYLRAAALSKTIAVTATASAAAPRPVAPSAAAVRQEALHGQQRALRDAHSSEAPAVGRGMQQLQQPAPPPQPLAAGSAVSAAPAASTGGAAGSDLLAPITPGAVAVIEGAGGVGVLPAALHHPGDAGAAAGAGVAQRSGGGGVGGKQAAQPGGRSSGGGSVDASATTGQPDAGAKIVRVGFPWGRPGSKTAS